LENIAFEDDVDAAMVMLHWNKVTNLVEVEGITG